VWGGSAIHPAADDIHGPPDDRGSIFDILPGGKPDQAATAWVFIILAPSGIGEIFTFASRITRDPHHS
jgi:hypothetical protein